MNNGVAYNQSRLLDPDRENQPARPRLTTTRIKAVPQPATRRSTASGSSVKPANDRSIKTNSNNVGKSRQTSVTVDRVYANLDLKYNIEATLLLIACIFVFAVTSIGDIAQADLVKTLLARFEVRSDYLHINGLMTLSFAAMGICWIINELFIRVAAVNELEAGAFARTERALVPALAVIWVVLPWIPELLVNRFGLGAALALMMSSQLLLQLLPWLFPPSSDNQGNPTASNRGGNSKTTGPGLSAFTIIRLRTQQLQRFWIVKSVAWICGKLFYWLGVAVEWSGLVGTPLLLMWLHRKGVPALHFGFGTLVWSARRSSLELVANSAPVLASNFQAASGARPQLSVRPMPSSPRQIESITQPGQAVLTRRQMIGGLATIFGTIYLGRLWLQPKSKASLADLSINTAFKPDMGTASAQNVQQPTAPIAKTTLGTAASNTYIESVAVSGMALQLQPLLSYHPPMVEDVRRSVINANEHAGKLGDIRWIVIHHSGTAQGNGVQFTLYHKDWSNTPYHFVIEPNGHIQWLQDLNIPSYNAGFPSNDPKTEYGDIINNHSIAICMVGNFDDQRPSMAQLAGLDILVRYFQQKYNVPADHVLGHKECLGANTRCPGANFNPNLVRQRLDAGAYGGLIAGETAIRDVPVNLIAAQRDFARANSIPEDFFTAALKAQAKWGISPWILLGLAAQESSFGKNSSISAGVAYDEVGKNSNINAAGQRQALEQIAKTLKVSVTEIRGTPGEGSLGAYQFQPATFLKYATTAASPFNVDDATDAAARLLVENGWDNSDSSAQQAALHRWNTRQEHTEAVLGYAGRYASAYNAIAAQITFA